MLNNGLTGSDAMNSSPSDPAQNYSGLGLEGDIALFHDNNNANIFDLDIQNWPAWLTDSNNTQYPH
jgi:hypothetical protein